MSVENPYPPRGAEVVGDEAAEWILRQCGSDWHQTDQAELDVWLAQSTEHLVAYWRLKAGWNRTERLVALKSAGMRPAAESTEHPLRKWLRLGAVACVIAVATSAAMYGWPIRADMYATALGQRATVKLSDGSQVQLNTDSAISIKMNFFRRTVSLTKGEAFFAVAHDATRPFSVLAAGHRITDLGTQFAVRMSGDRLEVALVEGRARLETVSASVQHHATDLVPGDVAIATTNSISVAKVSPRALANDLSWRQGKLSFSHATLAEAAAEFNRYNSTKLIVQPEIADLRISGVFDAGSMGPFTNVAKFAFGLRVERRGQEIVVSR